MKNGEYHTILGVKIHDYSSKEILKIITSEIKKTSKNISDPDRKQAQKSDKEYTKTILPIYTVNPEFVVMASELPAFKKILNNAYLTVPDGIGILYAGLLTGKRFQERITGIDLVHALTNYASENDLTVGFLGGKENAAEKTLTYFKSRYPNLHAWTDQGPEIDLRLQTTDNRQKTEDNRQRTKDSSRTPLVRDTRLDTFESVSNLIKIDQSSYDLDRLVKSIVKSDIVFVAFGAPKQELFIEWLKDRLKTTDSSQQIEDNSPTPQANPPGSKILSFKPTVCIGVGGSFDEISGISPQPPKWIQQTGLKWLFRLATEPWRWKRQTRLMKFVYLVIGKYTDRLF